MTVRIQVFDPHGNRVRVMGSATDMGRLLLAVASERRERVIESVTARKKAMREPRRTDGRAA